ncbi:MAG TPA: isovaleryl-CoA dehydrogenase, partial [Deltaproteobacteria bacterium]|nr:isovaleryl-CoA dehydrogenase [Deltaproteobacteria bacterium]
MLRDMVRDFTTERIEPQAEEFDEAGKLNLELFREAGQLGLLGITVPAEAGGSGMDATAAVIVHEEMSR